MIVAEDILRAPEPTLRALCHALDVPFDEAMLSWPAGPRNADGVWASHWYEAVHRSTGFAPPDDRLPDLDDELADLAARCEPLFQRLHRERLELA